MAYNGWTNYETWAVALWIDNEEGSYYARQELAEPFIAPEDIDEWSEDANFYETVSSEDKNPVYVVNEDGTRRVRVHNVTGYADAIQEWVETAMIPDLGASLASDLLGAALSEVNWREIAENWLDDAD